MTKTFLGADKAREIITDLFGTSMVPQEAGMSLLEETQVQVISDVVTMPRGVAWRGQVTFRDISLEVKNSGNGQANEYTSFGDWIDIEVLADLVTNAFPGLKSFGAPLDVFITMVEATHQN